MEGNLQINATNFSSVHLGRLSEDEETQKAILEVLRNANYYSVAQVEEGVY